MKSIIFFDVDDTLLDSRTHTIPTSTLHTLQEMSEYYSLGLSTGRSLSTLYDNGVINAANWCAYVCNNGQLVYDENKQEIYRKPIDRDVVDRIIKTAKERNEPVLAGTPDWYQIGEVNAYQEEAHDFFHIPIPMKQYAGQEDVFMMVTYGPKDCAYEAYEAIPGIQLMRGRSTYCDIIGQGCGKHIGIQAVLDALQLSGYIAFGDSDNDLGMLEYADYAIVMGQGSEQAKAHADYVTKAVYEDGIQFAWNHCSLLQGGMK